MGQAKRRQQQLGALYGTPEGSNADKATTTTRTLAQGGSLDLIGTLLTREDQIRVCQLLNGSVPRFRHSFTPVPGAGCGEVVVWGDGELAGVELTPLPALVTTSS
jgi:hypothetical protein